MGQTFQNGVATCLFVYWLHTCVFVGVHRIMGPHGSKIIPWLIKTNTTLFSSGHSCRGLGVCVCVCAQILGSKYICVTTVVIGYVCQWNPLVSACVWMSVWEVCTMTFLCISIRKVRVRVSKIYCINVVHTIEKGTSLSSRHLAKQVLRSPIFHSTFYGVQKT